MNLYVLSHSVAPATISVSCVVISGFIIREMTSDVYVCDMYRYKLYSSSSSIPYNYETLTISEGFKCDNKRIGFLYIPALYIIC